MEQLVLQVHVLFLVLHQLLLKMGLLLVVNNYKNMDTQQTITELEAVSADLKGQASGIEANKQSLLKRAAGIDLSVSQLKGILQTQADALEAKYQQTISDNEETINSLQLTISSKDTEILDLRKAVDDSVLVIAEKDGEIERLKNNSTEVVP